MCKCECVSVCVCVNESLNSRSQYLTLTGISKKTNKEAVTALCSANLFFLSNVGRCDTENTYKPHSARRFSFFIDSLPLLLVPFSTVPVAHVCTWIICVRSEVFDKSQIKKSAVVAWDRFYWLATEDRFFASRKSWAALVVCLEPLSMCTWSAVPTVFRALGWMWAEGRPARQLLLAVTFSINPSESMSKHCLHHVWRIWAVTVFLLPSLFPSFWYKFVWVSFVQIIWVFVWFTCPSITDPLF